EALLTKLDQSNRPDQAINHPESLQFKKSQEIKRYTIKTNSFFVYSFTKVTQQDMFKYMFGGETLETLIKEVDEEAKATESSIEHAKPEVVEGTIENRTEGPKAILNSVFCADSCLEIRYAEIAISEPERPDSDTSRALQIKNQVDADVSPEVERI